MRYVMKCYRCGYRWPSHHRRKLKLKNVGGKKIRRPTRCPRCDSGRVKSVGAF